MKRYIIKALLLLMPIYLIAQGGQLLETQSMESKILGKKIEYSVYLPHSYNSSSRSYPVLYLLHGYTDDETGWTQFGEVKKIADKHQNDDGVTV
jgi:S-formylglutathione hydrolase FrmB